MKTSEDTLERNEIVTESGRIFRPGNAALLEQIPPDIVKEMARRRLEEVRQYQKHREKKTQD
ncbi:hypothetical protein FACS189485_11330 [Spirochaetia bacterium]|nr:hypothetical protein FACS189485_11330 [Spirochaetia bacterium]